MAEFLWDNDRHPKDNFRRQALNQGAILTAGLVGEVTFDQRNGERPV